MTNPAAKRAFDVVFSASALLALSPVLLILACFVKASDRGPVFYRQSRVGKNGVLFRIWKFRTMVVDADRKGLSVTKDHDPRITRVGRWLRKTKLDEFPQLLNVLVGEMSMVGPRPEVPRYVEIYTPQQREILNLRPGITDLATLEFRNEEELLAQADDVEKFYIAFCIPKKIELNLIYAAQASFLSDLLLVIQTALPFLYRPRGVTQAGSSSATPGNTGGS